MDVGHNSDEYELEILTILRLNHWRAYYKSPIAELFIFLFPGFYCNNISLNVDYANSCMTLDLIRI